jgi:hypothetical protein
MTRIVTIDRRKRHSLVQQYSLRVHEKPNLQIVNWLEKIDGIEKKREIFGTYQNDTRKRDLLYFLMKHLDQETTPKRVKELKRDFGIPLTHAVKALEVLLQLPENMSLLDIFIRQKLIPAKLIPHVRKAEEQGIPISLTQSMKECIKSIVITSGLLN